MHEYELKILTILKSGKPVAFGELEEKVGIGHDSLVWGIENLRTAGAVKVDEQVFKSAILSAEGEKDLTEFPEEALVKAIKKKGKESISNVKDQIGLSWAKKNDWIALDKGTVSLTDLGNEIAAGKREYLARVTLKKLKSAKMAGDEDREIVVALIKRGLLELKEKTSIKSITITPVGAKMLQTAPKENGVGTLTKEIIANRTWERQGFKPYNIEAAGERVFPARLHPYRELANTFRQAWFEMGFVETSGPIIESAFWNFDALFSPQDHPTREMQDTFFLSNPEQVGIEDIETLQKVRKMHLQAWKEEWDEEIAGQAVLRTHTTSVSAHYMRKLALTLNANYPLKLFSIGPVFRNENLDFKHLAELHQNDGIIIGDNLTLSNLIDTLKKFYSKLGLDDLRFTPSYFPFTEPSLEVSYYDKENDRTIELAGGGIIRKEITKAMGNDKTVLAWGMGIDRFMLFKEVLGIDSIVTPYKNNVGWLRNRPNLKV